MVCLVASLEHMGYALFRAIPRNTKRHDLAEIRREKPWDAPFRLGPPM